MQGRSGKKFTSPGMGGGGEHGLPQGVQDKIQDGGCL